MLVHLEQVAWGDDDPVDDDRLAEVVDVDVRVRYREMTIERLKSGGANSSTSRTAPFVTFRGSRAPYGCSS